MHSRVRLFLLSCLLLVSITAQSQAPSYAGRPLREVLEEFRAAGLNLIYNDREIGADLQIESEPDARTPAGILAAILAPHGFRLEEVRPQSFIVVPTAVRAGTGRLWGIVKDAESQRNIGGAEIISRDGQRVIAAADGQYLFTGLPAGRLTLFADAPGYRSRGPLTVNIDSGATAVLIIELESRDQRLGTIVVTASRYSLLDEAGLSHQFLARAEVEAQPDLGEDSLRAVNRLPGVASSGLSARSNIRGGEENEVLILFDGMRLREPYHLKHFQDIFSTLDPGWIEGIDVYTGGYTAEYGDRMSGVIDMRARRPEEALATAVGLSFFNLSAQSEGQFAEQRGEWLVGLRRGTLDLLVDVVNPDVGDPSYTDAIGQVRYSLSDATTVSLNTLSSRDELTLASPDGEEQAGADYRNHYFWLKLDQLFGEHLAMDTLIGLTDFDDDRAGAIVKPELVIGRVDDKRNIRILGFHQNWRWSPSERFVLRWGLDLEWLDAQYDYSSDVSFNNGVAELFGRPQSISRRISREVSGNQYGAYLTQRLRLTPRLVAEAGLRWDRQTYTVAGHDDQTSPRLSLLYQLGDRTRLRASWGRYFQSQGIHELQVEDGIRRYFPAQRAEHTILSLEQGLATGWRLRIEAFRKSMTELRPRFEQQLNQLVLLPELEPDRIAVAPESAELEGFEVTLRADHRGPWSWWASYSRSGTEEMIDGREVRRSWDQRDAVGFGVIWQGRYWSFGAAGAYHTGWPRTAVALAPGSTPPFVLGERNAERYGDFASIDLRVSREFELSRGTLLVFGEVANALNRRNPCCTELELERSLDGTLEPAIETERWLPLLPSLGVRWRF